MEKLYVGINEAANLTSVSAFTIRRQIKQGKLQIARIGRRVVIPVGELTKLAPPAQIADSEESLS